MAVPDPVTNPDTSRSDSISPSSDKPGARRPSPDDDSARFLNRELSWLEFNRRVLHEAVDDRTPLLERLQFLSIFTSNLDEFFMKRVGGLSHQIAGGVLSRSLDGRTAAEQVAAIRATVGPMLDLQAKCYLDDIKPALREHGIHLLSWADLSTAERRWATAFFRTNVFAVLDPLAVDSGHPFPLISNLSQSLAVALSMPGRRDRLFARVKIPEGLPQWVRITCDDEDADPGSGETYRFVSLLEIVRHNLQSLFPGMEVRGAMPFRVTRNADVDQDEDDAEDLLELVEEEVRARRFATIVRLEHGPHPDPWILRFLTAELQLSADAVYELPGELDYTDLRDVAGLSIPALRFKPWTPVIPARLADDETDMFAQMRTSDMLVHHPYESFHASVERFIETAADDPDVLAIKMTLYRTGDDSPFIRTLIRAAEAGKQVVCMVELKARFDEQRNIQVAHLLENAGVHVVYGIVGLKTHTKTTLVVRREGDGLRSYAHIGTGNYHSGTARLYTDLGLLTADHAITADIVELFHYITGRSLKRDYQRLLVAPVNMKLSFLEMILREVDHHLAGRPACIVAKMNSLQDRDIIDALYAASCAGVEVDLIVRGFCCLRPGVPGLSDNIRVVSIIGRFLEHSRIFHFRNGCTDPVDGVYFIGSADWMSRNLHNRVEAVTPIIDRALRRRCHAILERSMAEQRQAWDLAADGSYVQRLPRTEDEATGLHDAMMATTLQRREAGDAMPGADEMDGVAGAAVPGTAPPPNSGTGAVPNTAPRVDGLAPTARPGQSAGAPGAAADARLRNGAAPSRRDDASDHRGAKDSSPPPGATDSTPPLPERDTR